MTTKQKSDRSTRTSTIASPKIDRQLLMLLAAGALIPMAGSIITPVLPEIVRQFEIDRALAGYLASVHYITLALFSPLVALVANRIGQVRVLAVSLIFYTIFGGMGGLIPGFLPLLVVRGFVGASSGAIAATSLGLMMEMYPSAETRNQAIAYGATAMNLANIVFPLLAGVLGAIHWRFAFCLYVIALPLAVMFLLLPQESRSAAKSTFQLFSANTDNAATKKEESLGKTLKKPIVLQLLFIICLASANAYASAINIPLYMKAVINSKTTLNGIVLASVAIGSAAMSAFGLGRLSKQIGLPFTTATGFGVVALTLFAMAQVDRFEWILPTAVVLGMGWGVVIPSLYNLLANVAPAKSRSIVVAMGTAASFIGQFLAPSLFAFGLSHGAVFYLTGGLGLIMGTLTLAAVRGKMLAD